MFVFFTCGFVVSVAIGVRHGSMEDQQQLMDLDVSNDDDDEGCIPTSAGLGSRAIVASDIILEVGSSASSKLVQKVSGWDMSHVMIVREAKNESVSPANQLAAVHVWVAESLEEGVKGRWLWNAFYDADFIRVHRMHCGPELASATEAAGNVCHGDWQKAADFLDFHIGSAYSYARLVPAGVRTLWQAGQNLSDGIWGRDPGIWGDGDEDPCPEKGKPDHVKEFMCSELVWLALQTGNFLSDDIKAFKGMSPKQLEQCALAGKRNKASNWLADDPQEVRTASLFIDTSPIPWHREMLWSASEPQACLGKDMVISFLETLRMDRSMTFSRWSIAAQNAGHHLGQGVRVGDVVKAKHAHGLFKDSGVTDAKLMDGLLDAFIILELTEHFNQQCQEGNYLFLYGVGFAAPKLEIMSKPFCKHGSLVKQIDLNGLD